MPSITQTIPSFTGGLSEQPDQLKFPGQVKDVQNAIPESGQYRSSDSPTRIRQLAAPVMGLVMFLNFAAQDTLQDAIFYSSLHFAVFLMFILPDFSPARRS